MNVLHLLSGLLTRELRAVKRELAAYENEGDLWATPAGITNSAGTLALHLAGNLSHFIGAEIGRTGYVRDRSFEFSARNVPRADLLTRLDGAIQSVEGTLSSMSEERLKEPYPVLLRQTRVRTDDFLLHLLSHAAYHRGQVNYHRRLVTGQDTPMAGAPIPELASATWIDSME